MNVFCPADILLPNGVDMERWAVIACDQFTSDQAYWRRVRDFVGKAPSTLHLILPEAELGGPDEAESVARINANMENYLREGVFTVYPQSYVYVERTLLNGTVRKGLVGMVDLEAYDYHPGAQTPVRATERTVLERIPPRQRVRRGAFLELPHVLMLCDDDEKVLLEPVAAERDSFQKLYDFDLMEGGGRVRGYLVSAAAAKAFDERLSDYSARVGEKYRDLDGTPVVFAVGDGNHSLATAKSCYEELKAQNPGVDLSSHPARYALVELENIHDDAQRFEPIHRIVTGTEPEKMRKALENWCVPGGMPVTWISGGRRETITLDPNRSPLAVAVLQNFLDGYLAENPGKIDYIHGEEAVEALASGEDAVGFLLPAMEKGDLFRGVVADGVLPRKTFSMGHAQEKRYYLEGRKIK